MRIVDPAGFCDRQVPVLSTLGRGPKGEKGDTGDTVYPTFANEPWSIDTAYDKLTVVLHEGNSYTAKQDVPVGIDISNTDFWAETGNYNEQLEQYRRELRAFTFVTPEMHGAKGDGETDDTIAIQAAFDYAKNNDIAFVMNKSYVITDTLHFADHDVFAANSVIKVKFAERNKPAVDISGRFRNFSFGTIIDYDSWDPAISVWTAGWHGWENKDYAGLHVNTLSQSTVSVACIHNFTSGILCESGPNGNSQYVAWNVFNVTSIRNCRYAYFFWNNHGAWMNANEFNNTEIAYQDSTTEFARSQLTRYGIYQSVTDYASTTLPSFSSSVFNNFKFEYHYDSPFVMAHVVSMSGCKFIGTRLEFSTIAEVPFEFDLSNDWNAYWFNNEYIHGIYMMPTLKVIRENTSVMKSSYEKCLKFVDKIRTTETIDFMDKQIQVSSNRCLLKNLCYGVVETTGNLVTDLRYSAKLSSIVTDGHLTTNNFYGLPVIILVIPNKPATVYMKADPDLPIIRCYDADMHPITQRSIYGGQAYTAQNTRDNYNYYTSGPYTECWLSFTEEVKYVMLLCVNAKKLTIDSADQIKVTNYIDPNDYSYYGLKSDVAPTGNYLPPFSKIWDFSDRSSLGAYWLYEEVDGNYSWVHHSA